MGVVATLAALVLRLLVASAKTTYDARKSEINQITAYTILLDKLLAQYGNEAQTARDSLHQAIPAMVERIWGKRDLAGYKQHRSRPRLRAKPSMSGSRPLNQAMMHNGN
jgi:hypothetical protein